MKDGELILLPLEEVFNRIQGVWNLSSDQGNLGTFFLTNVRVVWHANLASNFNVSMPHMQVKSVRLRESKFGQALVIETFARAGGYILGFRIDPVEKLEQTLTEIKNLHALFSDSPIFGVDFTLETDTPVSEPVMQPRIEEDVELIEEAEDTHAIAAYYADGGDDASGHDVDIQFDDRLGLAIEALHDGLTIEQLWKVI